MHAEAEVACHCEGGGLASGGVEVGGGARAAAGGGQHHEGGEVDDHGAAEVAEGVWGVGGERGRGVDEEEAGAFVEEIAAVGEFLGTVRDVGTVGTEGKGRKGGARAGGAGKAAVPGGTGDLEVGGGVDGRVDETFEGGDLKGPIGTVQVIRLVECVDARDTGPLSGNRAWLRAAVELDQGL